MTGNHTSDEHNLRVHYFGFIRGLVGKPFEEIALPRDASVRELIERLSRMYGEAFSYNVLDARGELRNTVMILLDGVNINEVSGLDTHVKPYSAASLVVMNPIGGG